MGVADLSIDLFPDTAAILNAIVSNSYYGILKGKIIMYLPDEDVAFKMAAVSVKRSLT